jgi:hypothetical protein
MLPGGAPTPSRSAAANRARRHRLFPAIRTPHERALEWKRRDELTRASQSGDKFFQGSEEVTGGKEENRFREIAYPRLRPGFGGWGGFGTGVRQTPSEKNKKASSAFRFECPI